MPRSVLLQLARDSIEEVLEMQRTIDKASLLKEHPLLKQKIATRINLYIGHELRGSSHSQSPNSSLIEDIIINAKKSAFEDTNFTPITTSQYLNCEVEVLLSTPNGVISEKDPCIMQTYEENLQKSSQ